MLADPVDADTWTNRPLEAIREQSASFEDLLDRFFAACAAHQAACKFGGEDPEDAFELTLDSLDRAPAPVPGGRPVDGDDARMAAVQAMLSPRDWPRLAAALTSARAGDGTPYASAKRLTADLGNARLLTLRGDGHDILSSLNPCILGQCSSTWRRARCRRSARPAGESRRSPNDGRLTER